MIVDDEWLALQGLEKHLRKIGGVEIIGMHQNPEEAYRVALRERPDLLFLDIDMPELNGLAFAERMNLVAPKTQIIFVTAHSRHAIAAFEQETLDYLLKPLRAVRLEQSLQRAAAKLQLRVARDESNPRIRLLGGLELLDDSGGPLQLMWRTQKTKELCAYLLHVDGRLVRKEVLAQLLWDESEEERAYARLYTTVYQLRRALAGCEQAPQVLSADEGYWIPKEAFSTDVERWERGVAQAPELTRVTLHQHLELIGRFAGDYLEGLDYPWAASRRQQLRMIWYYHAMRVARFLRAEGLVFEARTLGEQIRERCPMEPECDSLLLEIGAV